MPTDKTNDQALQKLQMQHGDQIEKFEYETWKEPFLGKEPRGAFCSGMTRYKKAYRVSHVVLKDGTRIPVGGMGCLVGILVKIVVPISLIFII